MIIDKIGRRITMIASCSMIAIFLLIFALDVKYNWSNVLPLICIFLYQLGFGLGMGPIPWFIIPEYFNDDVRSTATMIVVASNWIFSFIIIFVWPYMNDGLGMFGSLIFFLCISICAIIFLVFCIHEPSR
ncbi:glucose import [Tritrichomonas musculus]|uniref:Glucose import n=1 Tax=Tritrichomonas musculus TaxID=1915356 RepID=A0ABR2L502_9EUKA